MIALLPAALVIFTRFASATVDLEPAKALYLRGEYATAAAMLESLKRNNPGDSEVHFWLGKSCFRLRRWDDAVKALERAADLAPSSGTYHLWLGRAYGRKAENSFVLSAFGWARKTVRSFEKSVEVDPRNLDARFDLMEYYLEAPGVVGGGREKAERQAREIAELDRCTGFAARARVLQQDKKTDAAREELERATAACESRPETFVDLAELLLRQGETGGAEQAARQALALRGSYPRASLLLAGSLIESGKQLGQAIRSLRELSAGPLGDEDPGFDEVYGWLGRGLLVSGDRAGARQALETSLRFNPGYEPARKALSGMR